MIEFRNVSFSYRKGQEVLKDLSLKINKGEFVGIIGPNGGGKTTLLKLILGFIKPSSGELIIDPSFKHSIAYVPQSMKFDPHFPISVLELVLSGRLSQAPRFGAYSKKDREKSMEVLEAVSLHDKAKEALIELSGGQLQRAFIARALVSDPKLLLLDEPTASIDAKAEEFLYRILAGLRGKVTMLMVTHNLSTAVNQVDRVLCVHRSAIPLECEAVCEHFALGLYPPPLDSKGKEGL